METIEENGLISYLTEMPFTYRDKINLPEDFCFGTEIEFMVNKKQDVEKILRKTLMGQIGNRRFYKVTPNHRVVRYNNEKKIYEVKTPILHNTKEDFDSLKKVCDAYNSFGVMPSNQKGIHVHADLSLFEENTRFIDTFLKLFCVYEHIIFRFAYGEEVESNINMSSYSREISNRLYNYLKRKTDDISFEEYIRELRNLLKCKSYALNFHQKDCVCKNDTIEVRAFNSTMNPVIVQNDINFVLNMINQTVNNGVDVDLLDYRFSEYNKAFYGKESYSDLNLEDAIEFADMIFNTDEDRDYFLRQYVIKETPKKKKLVI